MKYGGDGTKFLSPNMGWNWQLLMVRCLQIIIFIQLTQRKSYFNGVISNLFLPSKIFLVRTSIEGVYHFTNLSHWFTQLTSILFDPDLCYMVGTFYFTSLDNFLQGNKIQSNFSNFNFIIVCRYFHSTLSKSTVYLLLFQNVPNVKRVPEIYFLNFQSIKSRI